MFATEVEMRDKPGDQTGVTQARLIARALGNRPNRAKPAIFPIVAGVFLLFKGGGAD
jgi:hypothetical protein